MGGAAGRLAASYLPSCHHALPPCALTHYLFTPITISWQKDIGLFFAQHFALLPVSLELPYPIPACRLHSTALF